MAIGTDTIAHQTALAYQGETIAVLGSGFHYIFPKENRQLFDNIIHNHGLVITEYETNTKPISSNFPMRNRIISALSEGILVIEAAYRSGTSITAKYAKEQGKKVFAIPGRLDNCYGAGVNKMIKDGAILTTEINDIIQYYPQFKDKKGKSMTKNTYVMQNIKEEYKEIYSILQKKEATLEQIMYQIKIDIKELISLLMRMEVEGIIVQEVGGRYLLKEK